MGVEGAGRTPHDACWRGIPFVTEASLCPRATCSRETCSFDGDLLEPSEGLPELTVGGDAILFEWRWFSMFESLVLALRNSEATCCGDQERLM